MKKSRERKIKKISALVLPVGKFKNIFVICYPIYIHILSTVVYSSAVLLYYLSDTKLGVKRVNKLSFDLC